MIQNPSGFTLDLDIIAYIFPMENGSLLLEDGGYIDVGRSLLDTRTLDLSELFVATASLGEDSWLVATTEEEDFTLGFLGGDVFSCDEVDGAETDHEDPEDTEVAPSLAVLVVNQLEECVGVAEWAVFTAGCSLGVGNVAASCLDVLAHIGVAGLLWEGFEAEELDFGTFDWDVGEGG